MAAQVQHWFVATAARCPMGCRWLASMVATVFLVAVVGGWMLAGTAQAAGPDTISLSLSPSGIVANGTSTTTATAIVTDSSGQPASDNVAFRSSDPNERISTPINFANGSYSVQITSSTTPGLVTITATDGLLSGQAILVQGSGTLLVADPSDLVTNEITTLFAAVSAASGSPSGTITFKNGGAPIVGCVRESITPSNPVAACHASFAARTSPEQITAVFTPTAASQIPGSSGAITLIVKPESVPVLLDTSTTAVEGQRTLFTATLAPFATPAGPVNPTGRFEFFDNGKPIHSCLYQRVIKWVATCALAYRALGTHTITARYRGDANFTSATSRARTIRVVAPPAVGFVASTMQWTFAFTSAYTKVVALVVNGATRRIKVLVACQGGGCPWDQRTFRLAKGRNRGTINLARAFRQQPLQVGAEITIAITRPSWIGKYYAFTMLADQAPRIRLACLAPGRTTPEAGC